MGSLSSVAAVTACILLAAGGGARRPPPASSASASSASIWPGVRINWPARQVELDGVIVNRDCPLELFACAGGFKNHESIVNLAARPLHVYQALGLLGCEPGSPAWWDERTDTYRPATGSAVDVFVQWDERGVRREANACEWMLDLTTDKPLAHTHWVFAGSARTEDGRFGADLYGTVVTVVDFGTAILAIIPPSAASQAASPSGRPAAEKPPEAAADAQHDSLASDLSLAAFTERIPPRGTRVVVVLRPRDAAGRPSTASAPTDRRR